MEKYEQYGYIKGVVLIIGYGSIGKGTLPLIQRHFTFDRLVILDPFEQVSLNTDIQFVSVALTRQNYKEILDGIFKGQKGFCVNLSVGTSSKDIILYCQEKQILYIDTVVEQWEGFYEDLTVPIQDRSNYALRENLREANQMYKFPSTAISCCGANPGMVSWLLKQALINLAKDINYNLGNQPATQVEWATLMMNLGVKGIHIAERDTQRTNILRPFKSFWNTWSVDGFISEGFYQASQLGWGTHQKKLPKNHLLHNRGSKCSIMLKSPGMNTKVKTWCPTYGPQFGFLVTHNEAISISDYFTVKNNDNVIYRPTCNYAYQPSEVAVSSSIECIGSGMPQNQQNWKVINDEIIMGMDQLGVLLYGHSKNAYWYGSQLTIQDTRKRAPNQNATGLQVTSAVLAGMVWALRNPKQGLVQNQQMDHKFCLQIQRPYIEPVRGYYTDWNPLQNKVHLLGQDNFDDKDPWQFQNIILNK